jgi:hypothetical protein
MPVDDDDQPIHVNFSDVEPQRDFFLLPAGVNVIVEITDFEKERTSETAKNPHAPMVNWTFTVESTEDGDDYYTGRVRSPETNKTSTETIKIEGRRIFERMVFVEEMLPRVMQFMEAMGYETEGDINIYPEQLVGERLMVQVGVQPRRKNKETGEWYNARNKVNKFLPLPDSEEDAPAPVAEEAPVTDEKKAKAKSSKEEKPEEAKV